MQILRTIYDYFNYFTEIPEHLIEPIGFLPDFLKEALVDSINLVPFLFVVFLIIELIEQYFAKKKHLFVFFMKKVGPLFGSLFASIPQCGFSVISSTLYVRRILSRGTLLSVYLATSDEAIPVLISDPTKIYLILPIMTIKIFLAVIAGYLVDILIPYKAKEPEIETHTHEHAQNKNGEEGCCHHKLSNAAKTKELWLHPIKHTIHIFIFILIVSIILGFIIDKVGTEENLAKVFLMNSPLQPILASIIGLIPNCAISVMLTVLFLKHTISFGSLIAGLSSAGGLGLLVLFNRNNDKKDTAIIITILIAISSVTGLILQYNFLNINRLFSIFNINL
ncbi:MAG: putative manganese transporter [Candidatus Gastranaerophilaceae bacterium]